MSAEVQMRLVGTRAGRVFIHLYCMASDFKVRWHMKGVCRELREAVGI